MGVAVVAADRGDVSALVCMAWIAWNAGHSDRAAADIRIVGGMAELPLPDRFDCFGDWPAADRCVGKKVSRGVVGGRGQLTVVVCAGPTSTATMGLPVNDLRPCVCCDRSAPGPPLFATAGGERVHLQRGWKI